VRTGALTLQPAGNLTFPGYLDASLGDADSTEPAVANGMVRRSRLDAPRRVEERRLSRHGGGRPDRGAGARFRSDRLSSRGVRCRGGSAQCRSD
jgi:hypothetical protein